MTDKRFCELDENKICDNCGKCIETDKEYNELLIDDILLNQE